MKIAVISVPVSIECLGRDIPDDWQDAVRYWVQAMDQ